MIIYYSILHYIIIYYIYLSLFFGHCETARIDGPEGPGTLTPSQNAGSLGALWGSLGVRWGPFDAPMTPLGPIWGPLGDLCRYILIDMLTTKKTCFYLFLNVPA